MYKYMNYNSYYLNKNKNVVKIFYLIILYFLLWLLLYDLLLLYF